MPTVQSTYENLRAGVPGHISHMVPSTLISRTLESASVAFGLAVSQGAGDHGVVTFDGNDVVGLVVRERSLPSGQDNVQQNESARIMTKGAMSVESAVAVAAGDPVHATAGGALSNTGGVAIANARWETSTTGAGQTAVVRLG